MLRYFLFALVMVAAMVWAAPDAAIAAAPAPETHGAVAGAEDHGDEAGETSLLNVSRVTFIWQVVLFLILMGVLSKFVWPQILKGLQAREQKQRTDLEAAEEAHRKAESTLAEYQSKLADARVESQQLIDQARTDADGVRVRLVNEAEAEIGRMRDRATDEIKLARQQALQDLYGHAATLATAVAAKVIQRNIDDADTQRLVDESLNELGRLDDVG